MSCEKCGKEIYIEDKIDSGYVDWCDCPKIINPNKFNLKSKNRGA